MKGLIMLDKTWAEQLPKEFLERMTCGRVFHVHIRPELYSGKCLLFKTDFRLEEGNGERFRLYFANHPEEGSIPSQMELLLMDINCAPTWSWHQHQNGMYVGEFAHCQNYKCMDDSLADHFPIIL